MKTIFVITPTQSQFNCSLVSHKNASTLLSSIQHQPPQKLVYWTLLSLSVDRLNCNQLQQQSSCQLEIYFWHCRIFCLPSNKHKFQKVLFTTAITLFQFSPFEAVAMYNHPYGWQVGVLEWVLGNKLLLLIVRVAGDGDGYRYQLVLNIIYTLSESV